MKPSEARSPVLNAQQTATLPGRLTTSGEVMSFAWLRRPRAIVLIAVAFLGAAGLTAGLAVGVGAKPIDGWQRIHRVPEHTRRDFEQRLPERVASEAAAAANGVRVSWNQVGKRGQAGASEPRSAPERAGATGAKGVAGGSGPAGPAGPQDRRAAPQRWQLPKRWCQLRSSPAAPRRRATTSPAYTVPSPAQALRRCLGDGVLPDRFARDGRSDHQDRHNTDTRRRGGDDDGRAVRRRRRGGRECQ